MPDTDDDARIGPVLLSAEQIDRRLAALAAEIERDHAPPTVGEVTFVLVLTGALVFAADLIRHARLPNLKIGLLAVSSYPGASTVSLGEATVLGGNLGDLAGRHVVLVDDILDSGNTLRKIVPLLKGRGAASVRTCVLLSKNRPEAADVRCDYVGFDIPDAFVVGYGLDYDDLYRNLPDIRVLRAPATPVPSPGTPGEG